MYVYSYYTIILLVMVIGSSPYVFNTSTLSRGQHNVTFSVIIDGEVRGLATETFTVLEGLTLALSIINI